MLGFKEFIHDQQQFPNEKEILDTLPKLDPVEQIRVDIGLHRKAIDSGNFQAFSDVLSTDSKWKDKLIDVFTGRETDPGLIAQMKQLIMRDIESHKHRQPNMFTGSNEWHQMWINVYNQWLQKLGEL